jgi:hypothetical protein
MSMHATNAFLNFWFKMYAATKGNQTSGDQKTQIVSPTGTAVTVTGTAIDTNIVGAVSVEQSSGAKLHTVVDQGSIDATVTQSTGSNLHTVVDSGAVTVSQSTGTNLHTVVDSGAVTVSGTLTGITNPVNVQQTAVVLPHNSSVANINAGATWSGSAFDSTLGVAGIQVNLVASQNCTVYVDQSMSGTNTDITDSVNYIASKGGNSWTFQATASFVKVRVKNTSPALATGVEIQTVLCPIVEALPRSLASDGCLKVDVGEIESNGFEKPSLVSPMRGLKITESHRLIGTTFVGTTLDQNFWTPALGTGGSVAQALGVVTISSGTTANNQTSLTSVRIARYVAANTNYARILVRLPTVTTASAGHVNVRRWGAYDLGGTPLGNGYFFEAIQTNPETAPTLRLYTRKDGTDSAPITSFNGDMGATYPLDTNGHTYEIYWTNSSVWFFIDDEFLHKATGSALTLSATPSLSLTALSVNSGNNNAANAIVVRAATINRLGQAETDPIYKNLTTAATTTLKYGAGKLHRVICNDGPAGSSLVIYDGVAGAGTIISTINTVKVATIVSLEFGCPFFTGLSTVMTGNVNCTFIYE